MVGVGLKEEMRVKGFPSEASFRYVLGRSFSEGLKLGDRWPAVCADFERGES